MVVMISTQCSFAYLAVQLCWQITPGWKELPLNTLRFKNHHSIVATNILSWFLYSLEDIKEEDNHHYLCPSIGFIGCQKTV